MAATSRNLLRQFPLGDDVDTLVICHSPIHQEVVVKAFQMKAMYALPFDPMTGRQFNRIIVFAPVFTSQVEADAFTRWLNENLQCKLAPGGIGEMHIV